jgi:putative ABC transport system ATP-binding protein
MSNQIHSSPAQKSAPVIEMNGVWRVYTMGDNEVQALRGISFSVERGEFMSIMGPSGSGKSTCMNMIGCLDRPSSGDVIIDGKKTADMTERELAHLRNETVGFVFQQYHLLSTMTVLENVMLPLRYQGISMKDRHSSLSGEWFHCHLLLRP